MNTAQSTSKKKRAKAVKNAIASEKLEGMEVSAEFRRLSGNYIAGKADLKKMGSILRQRYGIK